MIVIPSYLYSGDVSIKDGATLTVWVPIGAINNSDDLNLDINLVDVTRVDPIIEAQTKSEDEFANILGKVKFASNQPSAILLIDSDLKKK